MRVAEATGASRALARCVLDEVGGDLDTATTHVLHVFEVDTSLEPLPRREPSLQTRPAAAAFECQICYSEIERPEDGIELRACGHTWCRQCATRHVHTDAARGDTTIRCPADGCAQCFSQREIRGLIGEVDATVLETRALEQLVATDPSYHFCPNPSCTEPRFVVFWAGDEDGPPICDCPRCHQQSCLLCGARPFHAGMSCEAHQQAERRRHDAVLDVSDVTDVTTPVPPPPPKTVYFQVEWHDTWLDITDANATAALQRLMDDATLGTVDYQIARHQYTVRRAKPAEQSTAVVFVQRNKSYTTERKVRKAPDDGAPARDPAASTTTSTAATSAGTAAAAAAATARRLAAEEAATAQYLRSPTFRACPRCRAHVLKAPPDTDAQGNLTGRHGCDKMQCRCGYRFCYHCGAENARCGCTPAHHGFWNNLTGRADFSNL